MKEVKVGKQNVHGSHSTASHSPSPSDGCSYYYCVTVFIYCYPCKCCNERCLIQNTEYRDVTNFDVHSLKIYYIDVEH